MHVDAFTSSRLMAIDKQPAVCRIAIGEVLRCIIVRQSCLWWSPMSWLYLWAGLELWSCCACHASHPWEESTEVILLVDAKNVFDLLKRQLALLNIHRICPSIAPILTNLYWEDANLYVQNEAVISREVVMQGNPLAMAMFALGVTLIIKQLNLCHETWFADAWKHTEGSSSVLVHNGPNCPQVRLPSKPY